MTEVITEYDGRVEAEDGSVWSARACARPTEANWEAWIEFVPLSPGRLAIRTPTESTQPDRSATLHWAGALTQTYLEGALKRAQRRPVIAVKETAPPLFEAPAPTVMTAGSDRPATPHAILDPYEVYAQGEQRLVDQLSALDVEHLRGIVSMYEMVSPEAAASASRAELTTHILAAARGRK